MSTLPAGYLADPSMPVFFPPDVSDATYKRAAYLKQLGWNTKDIAANLGCSADSVYKYLYLARKQGWKV